MIKRMFLGFAVWMGMSGMVWAGGDAPQKKAATPAAAAQESGTNLQGESEDFDAYVNQGPAADEDGIKLADLDQDTSVILGGEDNLGVSLKRGYENSPLE